jgi:queuosine precursor transporter
MIRYAVFLLFLLTVPIANFLIGNFGTTCIPDGPCLIPVGFGLMAPSGVLMIGLALVMRDWLQELTNWKWSAVAVVAGSILSWLVADPFIAVASALAFLVAELFDLAVYTPLRKKGKHIAVLASGLVGAIIDSSLFVYIAFGSFEFSAGNTVGKLYATLIVAGLLFWKAKNDTLSRNANNTQK